MRLRKEKSLLPALIAANGDFILIRDSLSIEEISSLQYYEVCSEKNLNIVSLKDGPYLEDKISEIIPWGWDHAVIKDLEDNGIPENLLPSKKQLENLRNLSHRRTTIPFRKMMSSFLNDTPINLPEELHTLEEIEFFLEKNPVAYLKSPWSSSGRGIIVSDHITRKGLMEWCHGVLKHQGSVMAERAWNRVLDFATEWLIQDSQVNFLGVSVFETSSRGKYHGNIHKTQEELFNLIQNTVPGFGHDIIDKQKKVVENLIAPYYNGFLGIDMLSDTDGNINPCVELNLRLTMGHIPILNNHLGFAPFSTP